MRLIVMATLALWVLLGGGVVANNGVLFKNSKDESTAAEVDATARRRTESTNRAFSLPRPSHDLREPGEAERPAPRWSRRRDDS